MKLIYVTALILICQFAHSQDTKPSSQASEINLMNLRGGQESGGGIVFGMSGNIYVFGAEERNVELVVARHSETNTIYENVLVPQLKKIEKIWAPTAKYFMDRFEGRKGPRWYMSRFEMRPTPDLIEPDINMTTYSDTPGVFYQLARNNGDEIKISNFNPKIYPQGDLPLGETSALGWESIKSERSKAIFLLYELIEAELRLEAIRKKVDYRIASASLNQLVGLLMSENIELRYASDGTDFVDEIQRLIRGVNPELTGFYELLKGFDKNPQFENWENWSADQTGPRPISASCRNSVEDCVFLDLKTVPRRFGNYWSEIFASSNRYESAAFKSKTDVLELLKEVNQSKFGDFSDWRLPSQTEIEEAISHGILDVIREVFYFGNLPQSRELALWTSGLDDRSETNTLGDYPSWIFDLKEKKLKTTRYQDDRHAWFFVRNAASNLWEDASTKSDQVTPTTCQFSSDSCVLKLKETGALITEISPLNQDSIEIVKGYQNRGLCSKLNVTGWGGRKDWKDIELNPATPTETSQNFERMIQSGLHRMAMQYPKMGLHKKPIWSSGSWKGRPNSGSPYISEIAQAYSVVEQTVSQLYLYAYSFYRDERAHQVSWACISNGK